MNSNTKELFMIIRIIYIFLNISILGFGDIGMGIFLSSFNSRRNPIADDHPDAFAAYLDYIDDDIE